MASSGSDSDDDFFLNEGNSEFDLKDEQEVFITSQSADRSERRKSSASSSSSENSHVEGGNGVDRTETSIQIISEREEEPESDTSAYTSDSDGDSGATAATVGGIGGEPRNRKRTRLEQQHNADSAVFESNLDDDFFRAIEEGASKQMKLDKNTPKRVYKVNFVSKLSHTENQPVQAKVFGNQPFTKILPAILKAFKKEYKVPIAVGKKYTMDQVTLYWKTTKILNFMTCDSLKIPQAYTNEVSEIELTLVSKEYEIKFETEQIQKLTEEPIHHTEKITNSILHETPEIEEYERELRNAQEPSVPSSPIAKPDTLDKRHNTIKLTLVGQDNKKLQINAHPETQLRKLADEYRITKNLPMQTQILLSFDCETLDLNSKIEDNDLEHEDMIEVTINP